MAASTAEASSKGLYDRVAARLGALVSDDVLSFVARISIASIFFLSGRTKVDGVLHVTDSAVQLFADEYKLPLVDPSVAAHAAAYAEHFFPLLLVLGLCTRFAALALLGMTAVIEIFVYPDAWPTHIQWAAMLLVLLCRGAGTFLWL